MSKSFITCGRIPIQFKFRKKKGNSTPLFLSNIQLLKRLGNRYLNQL